MQFSAFTLVVAFLFTSPTAFAQDDAFDQYMADYSSRIATTVWEAGNRGLLFSANEFPAVGRLLRKSPEGSWSFCSGVMVTRRAFLTAAHCVCERRSGQPFFSAEQCLKAGAPNFFKNYVMLPTVGLFETKDEVSVSPDYQAYPDGAVVPEGTQLSDLAILQLTAPADVQPIDWETPNGSVVSYISAGFGIVSLNEDSARQRHIKPGPYKPGLGTLAFMDVKSCPKGYSDIICGHYSSLGSDPADYSAAVCQGDSGGPLLTISAGRQVNVLGIVSQRIAKGSSSPCDPGVAAYSVFTRVLIHRDWLTSVTRDAVAPAHSSLRCREGLIQSDTSTLSRVRVTYSEHSASLMVVAARVQGQSDPISLQISSPYCLSILPDNSLFWCRFPDPGFTEIAIQGNALVQVSTCEG